MGVPIGLGVRSVPIHIPGSVFVVVFMGLRVKSVLAYLFFLLIFFNISFGGPYRGLDQDCSHLHSGECFYSSWWASLGLYYPCDA